MKSSDFILLFFIIYNIVSTWILSYLYIKKREEREKQEKYIDELLFELAKSRKK